jgi:hypothetical protein
VSDSREPRSGRDRDNSFSTMDAFGKTADALIGLEPTTGALMKGAELAWRFLDKKIREEGRRGQS